MKLEKMIPAMALVLTLAACGGSDFEWFPNDYSQIDNTPPAVSASVSGKPLFNNGTTHLTSLTPPPNVIFFSNEKATIYYTTNGSEPTDQLPTPSPSVEITENNTSATGPAIIADTVLRFFGIDKSANKNRSAKIITTIKSP